MLYLQDIAKLGQQSQRLALTERLPTFITGLCHLTVTYSVQAQDDYYLMHMETKGELGITCQRCLQEFIHNYTNELVLSVCKDDEKAELLLDQYETVVAPLFKVDLLDLVSDELHLYAPQFHLEIKDCNTEVTKILEGN